MEMSDLLMNTLLTMLKAGLEISTDYMDASGAASKELELTQYIYTAIDFIEREGVKLNEGSTSDQLLITMYAMWLYDKRKTTGSKYTSYYIQNMPRMLRWNLNNRLFQQKVQDSTS